MIQLPAPVRPVTEVLVEVGMKKYDGVVIDPFWIDIAGRGDVDFPKSFYRVCCRASYVFQMGDWRRRRRVAEANNDFAALDRLDHEYEMIGM